MAEVAELRAEIKHRKPVTALFGRLNMVSIFGIKPDQPTAIVDATRRLIQTPDVFIHVMQFFIEEGLKISRDVSLVCMETDENHSWSDPSIAHIDWDQGTLIRHSIQRAQLAAQGRKNTNQTHIKTRFIDGSTIGSAIGS